MRTRTGAIGVVLLLAFAGSSPAAEWFVATNGNDAAAGTNWATSKLTIQAGIDVSASSDTIWVSNGVYATGGGRAVVGTWPNRVAVDKPVAVRSVNGPETTFIVGDGMRCAYVANGATLSGFMLTNGVTPPLNNEDEAYTNVDYKGGGAFCEASAMLSNCVLTGNWAYYSGGGSRGGVLNNCALIGNSTRNLGGGSDGGVLNDCILAGNHADMAGGGAEGGTLNDCVLASNTTSYGGGAINSTLNRCRVQDNYGSCEGGGVFGGTLNQCVVSGNRSMMGGGAARDAILNECLVVSNFATEEYMEDMRGGGGARQCRLYNCTVAGNTAGGEGGGIFLSAATNCIVVDNYSSMGLGSNYRDSTLGYSCTTPDPGGTGNLLGDPRFVDAAAGNYRLSAGSPCINAGDNAAAPGATDLDGNPRIMNASVDMGAFEFQPTLEICPASTNLFGDAASGLAIEVWARVPWTATTNADWITITSGESGTTNGTLVFTVASNSSAAARTGAIVVAGGGLVRTCAVIQAAAGPSMALGPEQFVLSGDAANGLSLAVTANVAWTAATNVPWLTITAGASGISNGTVAFNVASNGFAQPRAGAIQVSGGGIARTCTVVQTEGGAFVADWHVATNGNDAYDGRTWTMAKRSIQSAVDAATNGSTVWVSNGVYATGGGRAVVGTWPNRVAVDKPVAVASVNGPETTFIVGNGMRCAYVANGATLSGFTLTNGTTYGDSGAPDFFNNPNCRGGGAFCEGSAILSNCVLTGNYAQFSGGGSQGGVLNDCMLIGNYSANYGGGSSSGTLNRCVLTGNDASTFTGGGAHRGTLNNCLLTGNSCYYGAGASGSTLNNCTVAGNLGSGGGGVFSSMLKNCIVYGNTGTGNLSNHMDCTFTNSCTTPDPGGTGNITDDPQFVDAGAGNYRLQANSPCIDGGNNGDVAGTTDLDGNPRIMNASVDMGAFEYFQTTWFVATNGNDAADGTTWAKAKATIQAAVDVAPAGKIVAVSNGVYATGGRAIGSGMTNRVAIDKPLTVRSVNGPGTTSIHGAGPCGPAAVRCAYVGTNAVLSGFTLTNGATRTSGDSFRDQSGGGAWGEPAGVVTNCILTGNMAARYGGGAQGGTLNNCVLTGNRAEWSGGGSSGSTLNQCTVAGNSAYSGGGTYGGTINRGTLTGNQADWSGGGSLEGTRNNCLLAGNSAVYGGGAHDGTLNNCTVAGNSANYGGGSYVGTLNNCIVYSNTAPSGPNFKSSAFNTSCTSPDPGGTANIVDEPQFVDAAAGDYHLRPSSPCINHGAGAAVQGAADLDGNPRIVGGSLDLGAYESQLRGYCAWIGAVTNGLTNDTDCAAGDGMPNLLKYATGGSPREPDDLALLSWVLSNGVPVLVFHRNPEATDVELLIQGADAISDEAEWRGLATNRNGSWGGSTNVEETGTGNPVECTVTDPVALQSNRFLRLRVSRP